MKKELLLLVSGLGLTGCVVYHPGPMGEYGDTYDMNLPVADVAPAVITRPGPIYVNAAPPPTPIPPVFSDIPEATRQDAAPSAITSRTVILPPATAIREPSGAARTEIYSQPTTNTQQPYAEPVPIITGDVFTDGTVTNINGTNINGTNINGTNIIATNPAVDLSNTNSFGIFTTTNQNVDAVKSNLFARTNQFNEAAGAQSPKFAPNTAGTQALHGVTVTNQSGFAPQAPNQNLVPQTQQQLQQQRQQLPQGQTPQGTPTPGAPYSPVPPPLGAATQPATQNATSQDGAAAGTSPSRTQLQGGPAAAGSGTGTANP